MAAPISPLEAIQIVQKVVALYKKIRVDAPEQITKVGKRMERLEEYLLGLQELLDDKTRHNLALLRPAQTQQLRSVIKDIRSDAEKVYALLEKWDNAIGPFGLELRFKTVAQAWFAVGSSPDKLNSLCEDIQQRQGDLRDFLQLLGWFGVNQLLVGRQPGARKGSPSPSPEPIRRDYGVIFVDPFNVGCSRVAEAYTKLVKEWTTRTNGDWRIKFAHSAGIGVRNRSDCTDVLESLSPPLTLKKGDKKPNQTAMAALFDNKLFNQPYKSTIKDDALSRTSRGVTQSLFSTHDFILVFAGREYEDLIRLREALTARHGLSVAPKGKGRIVHLGAYLSKGGKPVDIKDAPKDQNGTESRANWNKTVANIKISVKAFLKSEMAWVQPK